MMVRALVAVAIVAGAIAASLMLPDAARAQNFMCSSVRNQFEAGTWTANNRSQLEELEDRANRLGCQALEQEIERVRLSLRNTAPSSAQTETLCDRARRELPIIVVSTDVAVVERFRDTYRTCSRETAAAEARRVSLVENPPGELPTIAYNRRVTRSIARGDLAVEGLTVDQYALTLRRGEGIAVTVQSETVEPILAIGAGRLPDGYQGAAFAEASELNESVTAELIAPTDGEYVIVVATRGQGAQAALGDYSIELNRYSPPPPPPPRPVVFNEPMSGELTRESARLPDQPGYLYEPWSFSARAGERVQIDMIADWDTYLVLGQVRNGEFVELARDDDGGDGVNAQLRYVFQQDGEYVIWARSFGRDRRGTYQLTIRQLEPVGPAQVIALARRAQAWHARGALGASVDEAQRPYQEFEFRAPRDGGAFLIVAHSREVSLTVDVSAVDDAQVTPVDIWAQGATRPRNQVELASTRNTTYRVRVTGARGEDAEFDLTISPR